MTDEKRDQPRVPLLLDVAWEGTGQFNARTSDISLGGCFVDSVGRVSEGERIRFKVRLPEGEWIQLQSVVAYIYPNIGFGVRFIDVPAETLTKLERVIDRHTKNEPY